MFHPWSQMPIPVAILITVTCLFDSIIKSSNDIHFMVVESTLEPDLGVIFKGLLSVLQLSSPLHKVESEGSELAGTGSQIFLLLMVPP